MLFLFLNPVGRPVGTVLLGLGVIQFPEMEEVRLVSEAVRNLFRYLLRVLGASVEKGGVV